MFVLPLARPAQRAAAPQFSRFIDRLFDESFEPTAPALASRTPALDVSETDAGYSVAFEVPGVTREQLTVSVEGRRVSLATADVVTPTAAAVGDQPEVAAPRALYRERSTARYARTVSLPAEVDPASATAKFENGVLTLTLAKKVATGATRIAIN
jgi:HSP20 family protein